MTVLTLIKKQAHVLKSYPSKLMFTSLQCASSAIQSFVIAIAVERDIPQWKLGWNMRLLAVVYGVSIKLMHSIYVITFFTMVHRWLKE